MSGNIIRYSLDRGLFLHAVAVQAPAGALLLLGHSGAGKSTLGRLLSGRFPVLADDNIYLARSRLNQRWYMIDAKRLQEKSVPFAPVLAMIRTFQAQQAQLVPISQTQACRYLLDAVFEIISSRDALEMMQWRWFASVAEVARSCPAWRLSATLQAETPALVWECFK
ncbi:MAG TPA: hypothetical protein PLO28_13695 [bacterium]|nr:hypothetical protein [bacterium]